MSKVDEEVEIGEGLRLPKRNVIIGLQLGWESIKESEFGLRDVLIIATLIVSIFGVVTNFV